MKRKTIFIIIACTVLLIFFGLVLFMVMENYENGVSVEDEGEKEESHHDPSEETLLTLTINLDKKVYNLNEPIEIKVDGIIENISQAELIINTRFSFPGPELNLKLMSDTGKALRWLPPVPPRPLTKHDFKTLGPGEKTDFTLIIYGSDLFDKLDVGTYVAQAKYFNSSGDEFGFDAWQGRIYSNKVSFEMQ